MSNKNTVIAVYTEGEKDLAIVTLLHPEDELYGLPVTRRLRVELREREDWSLAILRAGYIIDTLDLANNRPHGATNVTVSAALTWGGGPVRYPSVEVARTEPRLDLAVNEALRQAGVHDAELVSCLDAVYSQKSRTAVLSVLNEWVTLV